MAQADSCYGFLPQAGPGLLAWNDSLVVWFANVRRFGAVLIAISSKELLCHAWQDWLEDTLARAAVGLGSACARL